MEADRNNREAPHDDRRCRPERPDEVLRRRARPGARGARDRHLDRAGRDGRAARPERRRQVDDDRHAARAARRPTSGAVTVFGAPPREAVAAGPVGAMLQTGALIRDLSVRELVTMMASLYPQPLGVDEVLELTGIDDIADRRTQKLSGGETQRVALRGRARQQPRPARARRADGRDGRRGAARVLDRRCASSRPRGKTVLFATHYLEEADAYADRVVLMAHGPDRRRRADDRDQGDGRRRGRSGRRCPTCRPRALGALPGVTRAERRGEAVVLTLRRLRRGDPRAARRASRRRATSRSAAPGSRRRSSS